MSSSKAKRAKSESAAEKSEDKSSSSKKEFTMASGIVVLITGASSGIGLALAKLYSKRPNHTVIGTCRDMGKSKELVDAGCTAVELDVSSDESCAQLPKRLAEKGVSKVHLLINNAGILINHNLDSPNIISESMDQINTNALGPLRVTIAVLPLLRKAVAEKKATVKIANISSRMGSIEDNTSGGYYGYRASKAAENIISVSLSRDLAKEHILSLALHPGYVATKMVGGRGHIDADSCALGLSKVIDKAGIDDCFKFLHQDGSVLPW